MKKNEFSFIGDIATLFSTIPHHGFEPIGDDCTLIELGDDALVMTTDMLVEDVHFLRAASSAEEVGEKSLLVNLSDVAAMGATPIATMLSIALPANAQEEWAEGFMRGYHEASHKAGVALVGGDTTSSRDRITINVVAIGRAPKSNIKRRRDARVGDAICVTGKLGRSSKGLVDIMFGDLNTIAARHHRVAQARITEGVWLGTRSEVHAMMDVSDGIASDIKHIMEMSKVGAEIDTQRVPTDYDLRYALSGGEDYELLLTVDSAHAERLCREFEAAHGTPLTIIGRITEPTSDDVCWMEGDKQVEMDIKGFTHF